MNVKSICLFVVIQLMTLSLSAQDWYVSPSIGYYGAIATQTSPIYFQVDDGPNYYGSIHGLLSTEVEDFSLSSGWAPGLAVGYNLSGLISVELELAYFKNKTNTNSSYSLESDWKYSCASLTPSLVFNKHIGSGVLNGKWGVFLGSSKLSQSVGERTSCEFDPKLVVGTQFSIGYSLKLSKVWSISTNLGVLTYNYKPKTAKVHYPHKEAPFDERKIEYYESFDDIKVYYDPSGGGYTSSGLVMRRLEEKIVFRSLFFKTGLTFSL